MLRKVRLCAGEMNISIIVPVLNEAALIRESLTCLRQRAPKAEIVVVDGTSSDRTTEFAAGLCNRLLQTVPGRARQMNTGARAAEGEVLWFLHIDATISESAIAEIESALKNREIVGGFFRMRFPRRSFIYRFSDCFAHYAGLLLRIRYGDHGFFCRREIFDEIGGFPEVALMEDADFFRKLRRAGRITVISQPIVVNPRRYERIGPFRLTLAFGLIGLLYFFQAPRQLLEKIYLRTCCRSS
jgi:rSAM/selenodomain-associated transferase 2